MAKKKKKSRESSGLKRYQAKLKRATKGISARIKKAESTLKKLRGERKRKVKKIQQKLRKH